VVPVTRDLGGLDKLAWVVGAWSLSSAVSFSLAGPLSDVFGRRLPMLVGEVVTIVGCIVAGVAQNISTLIVGESFIGLGTGVVFVAYAGVPEMLPNKWRSLGLGILEAGIAVPWGMISAILGNALNEYASWRWILYISVIVEAIALVGTAFFYWPTPRPRGDFDKSRWDEVEEIDFIGLFLFTGGLTTFLIGLTWGGTAAHPWKSAGCIAPIVIGFLAVAGCLAYDFTVAKHPMFPLTLFTRWRQYTLLLAVLFISGMNFYSMAALLPQGSLYMFETSGLKIGIMALPNTIMQGIVGVGGPLIAHKIGHIKWQLVFALALQATFVAATAGSVYPNHKLAYMFIPAFGVPIFVWVTILSYAIASLHVPHSRLGVAMGLLGTFRASGGAVGNAVFGTIFVNRFGTYSGPAISAAALSHGLRASDLPEIIPATIEYNLGVPGVLDQIPGMTQAIQAALRMSVRSAYGHAFKIVFYLTIPFSVIALFCALFVEDPTMYMTNHIQFAMNKDVFPMRTNENASDTKDTEKAIHVEQVLALVDKQIETVKH
jgi:MFS family permease